MSINDIRQAVLTGDDDAAERLAREPSWKQGQKRASS